MVGESIRPCQTPTVVLNHSPVLPLNSTALCVMSYRFCDDSYCVGVDIMLSHS